MNAQTIIDTALAASASILGAPEASTTFKESYKNSYKINVQLKPSQRRTLEKICPFPLVFLGTYVVTNDHPLIVAMRGLTRDIFEKNFKISQTTERTLVIGSAMREMTKYNANPNIHYHIHGTEAKDYDRIIRPALKEITNHLKSKAAKNDYRINLHPVGSENRLKMRPIQKRYRDAVKIFKDYVELNNMPNNVHFGEKFPEVNTLVFEDSIYNLSEKDLLTIFRKTDAKIGYGYGFFPMELIFGDLPINNLYSYRQVGPMASVTFKQGYCNGYEHYKEHWDLILRKPVFYDDKVAIAVEITSRVGPMMTFKLMRVTNPDTVVREIGLNNCERFVKILDVKNCVNKTTGKIITPLKYISVYEDEFVDTVNYATTLDPKSLTFTNLAVFVRRRMGGMCLINQELLAPWNLPDILLPDFCSLILLYVKLEAYQREVLFDNIGVGDWGEKFKAWFRGLGYSLVPGIYEFFKQLFQGHLVDKLVLFPDNEVFQRLKFKPGPKLLKPEIFLTTDFENVEDVPDCPFCFQIHGKMGDQIVKCNYKPDSKHLFKMTNEMLTKLKTSLIDNDKDPAGLKSVKEKCLKNLPTCEFEREVRVEYVYAGPGCGKSYLIRKMATQNDLVLAPFTKLKGDYEGLKADNGDIYDLMFKTTHRAMETRGCSRVFLDEFTSMPYEYLACILEVNGATEVIIVGDEKQTKVQEPTEGIYIGSKINLAEISKHTLVKNFRNAQDVVALLNKLYGYEMVANSNLAKSITVVNINEWERPINSAMMAFTTSSAIANTQEEKNTVRSNQGGTFDNATLFATSLDGVLIPNNDLQIVGLSRHKINLTIVTDGCEASRIFLEKLNLTNEFYGEVYEWSHPKINIVKQVANTDPIVDIVLAPEVLPSKVSIIREENKKNSDKLKNKRDFKIFEKPIQRKARLDKENKIRSETRVIMSTLGKTEEVRQINLEGESIIVCDSYFDDELVNQTIVKNKPTSPLRTTEYPRIFTSSQPKSDHKWIEGVNLDTFKQNNHKDFTFIPCKTHETKVVGAHHEHNNTNSDIEVRLGIETIFLKGTKQELPTSDFKNHVETFMSNPNEELSILIRKVRDFNLEKPTHPVRDAYRLTELVSSKINFSENRGLNDVASTILKGTFNSGVLNVDNLLCPLNKRNHPLNLSEKYYSLGSGIGNYFSAKNPVQTLSVLEGRYLCKQPFFKFGYTEERLVEEIVDNWFSKCVKKDYIQMMYDDATIQSIMNKYIGDLKRKSNQSGFEGAGGIDAPDGRVIRFQLKSIFKPSTVLNTFKVGQGISAWSTSACTMFCGVFRLLTQMVSRTELDNVITDSYMDESAFINRVNKEFKNLPEVAINAVTDGETFDANQNAFTQALERAYWARYGISKQFLDFYYSFRVDYKINSSVAYGKAGTQKTSGEPGTLVNNGIVSKLISHYVLNGDGPSVTIYKGDDYCKRQCNITLNKEHLDNVNAACALKLKTNIGSGADFCGLIYYEGNLFPSIPRKLNKITAHRFRNYKHFCEYQASLRDWINRIVKYGEKMVIGCNAALAKTTYLHMETQYMVINSWAHIDEATFNESFGEMKSTVYYKAEASSSGDCVVKDV